MFPDNNGIKLETDNRRSGKEFPNTQKHSSKQSVARRVSRKHRYTEQNENENTMYLKLREKLKPCWGKSPWAGAHTRSADKSQISELSSQPQNPEREDKMQSSRQRERNSGDHAESSELKTGKK